MADKKSILIIEGDHDFADMIANLMAKYGFEARITTDGEEGVRLAEAERPTLIVLCVELGSTSGYMICKKLKKEEPLSTIPLILTSSEATEKDFEQHRKLKVRADDYLFKPFNDEGFITRIQNLLGFELSSDEYKNLEEKVHDFLEEKVVLENRIRDQADLIQELESKVAQLEAEGSVGAALSVDDGANAAMEARLKNIEEELTVARDRLDQESRSVQSKEAARADLEREVTQLRRKVEDASDAAASAASSAPDPTELRALKGQVEDLQERLQASELNLSTAKESLEDLDDLRVAKRELEEKLKSEVDRTRNEYEAKLADREKKDEERKALREQLTNRVNELTEEKKELKNRIQDLEAATQEVQRLKGELEAGKAQSEEKISELEDQAEALRKTEAELMDEVRKLAEEKSALESEKRRIQVELANEATKRKKMRDILALASDVD